MNLIFYIAAAIAITATLMAITRHNAIHALMYLILSLLSVSVIFYILGSPLVAALEVLVYAGAIMVLFIFIVMMLNVGMEEETEKHWIGPKTWIVPSLLSAALLIIFIFVLKDLRSDTNAQAIGPKQVGITLFTTYMLAVEIAAMLLLAGIVGSYHLGRQKKKIIHRFMKPVKTDKK
ncbi:MAG TPA: NADH-quinone oxidoreductase subunit J [Bacteroidales bacterium]|jgi:NADH-quinone oxidoreductase subunit J|nr:NADH-quinone oxidoreductase subunit J [Bacteroidales bacterium]